MQPNAVLWSSMQAHAGKSYRIGKLSSVDLLVLTSSVQLLSKLKIVFTYFKTSYLNEEVSCTEPSPSISIPWPMYPYAVKYSPVQQGILIGKAQCSWPPHCFIKGSNIFNLKRS
jgi:hypothetical protein